MRLPAFRAQRFERLLASRSTCSGTTGHRPVHASDSSSCIDASAKLASGIELFQISVRVGQFLSAVVVRHPLVFQDLCSRNPRHRVLCRDAMVRIIVAIT